MNDFAGRYRLDTQMKRAGDAEGATVPVDPIIQLPPPPPPLIAELIEWQGRRVLAIRMQSKIDNGCDAYVARYLGYHSGLSKAEGRAIYARAAKMRTDVEKQARKEAKKQEAKLRKQAKKSRGRVMVDDHFCHAPDAADGEGQLANESHKKLALAACLPIIINTIQSRACWDALRTDAERRMREIARGLPVWPRCESIAGFGDLPLACLIAEAGNDLSAYPHWYHLWKRLGLAPYRGKAMSTHRREDKLSKAEWTEAGYNPSRRGRMAGDIGVPLFLAKARNDYGAVYAKRRERTAVTHPDWTDGHSDNDARRIMLKALIADLWRWWLDAAKGVDLAIAA